MDFFAEFQRHVGAERYEKFVATSRAQSRTSGRLLFWQESLLDEFAKLHSVSAPKTLTEVVDLSASSARSIAAASGSDAKNLVESPVYRKFQSSNQQASGGSHLTVFDVVISPSSSDSGCRLSDASGPHLDRTFVVFILDALERGISRFVRDSEINGFPLLGFDVKLRDYPPGSNDFRSSKHEAAIYFLLLDLLSETRTNRHVQSKLVGIPL